MRFLNCRLRYQAGVQAGVQNQIAAATQLTEPRPGRSGGQVRDLLDYICHHEASEQAYPNGVRDRGRGPVRLSHFVDHPHAKDAKLNEAEVGPIRVYTPFRVYERWAQSQSKGSYP